MFEFVYTTCQPSSAKWLKEEARARHPELRFAFSRPGLVTFKSPKPLSSDFRLELAFARSWGFSFGPVQDWKALESWLTGRPRARVVQAFRVPTGEEDDAPTADALSADALELESLALERLPGLETGDARLGDWVLDLVTTGDGPPLAGLHLHENGRSPFPGGPRRVPPPAHAPSRAYSKLEEAIEWLGLPMSAGQGALELGSSPGGAVLSLIERGLDVVAVDPAPLSPTLAPRALELGRRLLSHEKSANALTPGDLPFPVHWLLSDMNLAPQVALHSLERVASLARGTLRGAVITLKMNDARAVASIPALRARLATWGLGTPVLGALPSHRQEVVAVLRRPDN
ncbi:MAG TPA: SAM-dependent methyltransferase [Polyangiaceae bacterium]|nr:SAM-dependent methyltransferase [Polyangiaceae bacterium]